MLKTKLVEYASAMRLPPPSLDTEEGRKRPDVTVRLPGGAVFVIDAKCSLNAFLDLQDATDEASRDGHGQRHVQSLKGHVSGLSAREYWKQFENFVLQMQRSLRVDEVAGTAANDAATATSARVISPRPPQAVASISASHWLQFW